MPFFPQLQLPDKHNFQQLHNACSYESIDKKLNNWTVSGSLVAHQHTSLVVFYSALHKETLCIIVPSAHFPVSQHMSCTDGARHTVSFVNYCHKAGRPLRAHTMRNTMEFHINVAHTALGSKWLTVDTKGQLPCVNMLWLNQESLRITSRAVDSCFQIFITFTNSNLVN